MKLKEIIELGLVDDLKVFLSANPECSNRKIIWGEDQEIETDPLHYVSDCVFNGVLTNGNEAEVAKVLLEFGARLEGSENAESPLIGAVSLSAIGVAEVLIDAGAIIDATSVHGASSLHWAAYVGLPSIVSALLNKGANIEKKCIDFKATPVFWAVQGFRKSNRADKSSIVDVAKILVGSGADVLEENFEGCSAFEYSHEIGNDALIRAIESGT